jgi:DNA invertase Pin-like site-specific DNA recombinase
MRLAELDRLIAAGLGAVPGSLIKAGTLETRELVGLRPRYKDARGEREAEHVHHWNRKGMYRGRQRFLCRRCMKTRTVSTKLDERRMVVSIAIRRGHPKASIARDLGVGRRTVYRIAELIKAGLL